MRVLAIGQLIEAKDGKKLAEGNTATLELTPRQAELLALANSMGEISLSLRSIADIDSKEQVDGPGQARQFHQGSQVRSEVASVWRQLSLSAPQFRAGKKVGKPCE